MSVMTSDSHPWWVLGDETLEVAGCSPATVRQQPRFRLERGFSSALEPEDDRPAAACRGAGPGSFAAAKLGSDLGRFWDADGALSRRTDRTWQHEAPALPGLR